MKSKIILATILIFIGLVGCSTSPKERNGKETNFSEYEFNEDTLNYTNYHIYDYDKHEDENKEELIVEKNSIEIEQESIFNKEIVLEVETGDTVDIDILKIEKEKLSRKESLEKAYERYDKSEKNINEHMSKLELQQQYIDSLLNIKKDSIK